jgi:acetyl esterase/lipase
MVSWTLLFLSLIGAALAYNVWYPRPPGGKRAVVSFFAGWLTGEWALHQIALQMMVTAALVWMGALDSWPGWLGLAISIGAWAGLWRSYWSGRSAATSMENALTEGLGEDYRHQVHPDWLAKFAQQVDWRPIAAALPRLHPEVERHRDITFSRIGGINLKLDVYRHRSRPQGCPALLQIHGGGWCIGSKNEQGLPLMMHMAARGWVCVSADYRLSPRATFPDHIVDVKRAIEWIRTCGAEYGIDPNFVVITGGSAGGHLSALAALTANDPEYQPGFEEVDTSVSGCVPFYGVYDFVDREQRLRSRELQRLLAKRVMKVSPHAAPELYEKASPVFRAHPEAPPFLIVHGTHDSLVSVEQARQFAGALRSVSKSPVLYAEIPGAQHAFEIFPSLRTELVIPGVERFLAWLHSRYLAKPEESRAA